MPFEGLEAPHAPENPSDSGARAKPPPRARVTPFSHPLALPFPRACTAPAPDVPGLSLRTADSWAGGRCTRSCAGGGRRAPQVDPGRKGWAASAHQNLRLGFTCGVVVPSGDFSSPRDAGDRKRPPQVILPSPNPRPPCARTFVEIRTLGTCASCERQKAHTVLARGGAPAFCSDGRRCGEARARGRQLLAVWTDARFLTRPSAWVPASRCFPGRAGLSRSRCSCHSGGAAAATRAGPGGLGAREAALLPAWSPVSQSIFLSLGH